MKIFGYIFTLIGMSTHGIGISLLSSSVERFLNGNFKDTIFLTGVFMMISGSIIIIGDLVDKGD